MAVELNEQQAGLVRVLLQLSGPLPVEDVAKLAGLDQAQVSAFVSGWEANGWVQVDERVRKELAPAAVLPDSLFPELDFVNACNEPALSMSEAAARASELGLKLNEVVKWGTHRGWLQKQGGELRLTDAGMAARQGELPERLALGLVAERPRFLDEVAPEVGITEEELENRLGKRSELARLKPRRVRSVSLTEAGTTALSGQVVVRRQQTRLSSEDIVSGAWRRIDLRPYDVTLAAETAVPVKPHPFQRMLEDVRRAFLEMGFTEVVSPMVESAFWDFDALYQPQDHPARDMQDTFYLDRPKIGRLPAEELVERVRRTHEDGWETGSTGWGYRWNRDRAREMVLRTHTTATTIRALAEDPNPPRKVFCVGRVFRNENITYKHLPEFHQVDGVIIDKDANFATLLGTLREFYRKMGFERIKFKPEFFPYTEPSAGVFVYMESKQRWLELGGSGVFRPEVTRPLGCEVPVLAWGLGLERLAMTLYGIQDIRTLYWTDLDWLKEVRLCQ